MSKLTFIETAKKKPCVLSDDGNRYLLCKKNKTTTYWRCSHYFKNRCKGSITIDGKNQITNQVVHSCIPDHARNAVEIAVNSCRKRVENEAVPIPQIVQQEFQEISEKGFESVTQVPTYLNLKTSLHRKRAKKHGTQAKSALLKVDNLDVGGCVDPKRRRKYINVDSRIKAIINGYENKKIDLVVKTLNRLNALMTSGR